MVVRTGQGHLYAIADICPHEGARLSEGFLGGTVIGDRGGDYRIEREGEVVRCPWHNFAYDVTTGRSLHDAARYRVKTYAVRELDGRVAVEV
jgi:3-phenylpropionate/trans-cinnamate dioxygenase ferredoxin subunit